MKLRGYLAPGIHVVVFAVLIVFGSRGGQSLPVAKTESRANLPVLPFMTLFSVFGWLLASEQEMNLLGIASVISLFAILALVRWYLDDFQEAAHQVWHKDQYRSYVAPAVAGLKPGFDQTRFFMANGAAVIDDFHINSSNSKADAEEAREFIENAPGSMKN